jgi:hypothetical protein
LPDLDSFGYVTLLKNWVQNIGHFVLFWVFEEPKIDLSWFRLLMADLVFMLAAVQPVAMRGQETLNFESQGRAPFLISHYVLAFLKLEVLLSSFSA